MATYAVIENGKVVNICVAELSDIKPDTWVLCKSCAIGWDYVEGQFTDNRPIPESIVAPAEPTKEQLLAELQALTAKINALG